MGNISFPFPLSSFLSFLIAGPHALPSIMRCSSHPQIFVDSFIIVDHMSISPSSSSSTSQLIPSIIKRRILASNRPSCYSPSLSQLSVPLPLTSGTQLPPSSVQAATQLPPPSTQAAKPHKSENGGGKDGKIPHRDPTNDVRLGRNRRSKHRNHLVDRRHRPTTSHRNAHSRHRPGRPPRRPQHKHRRPHLPHPPRSRKSEQTTNFLVLERRA